MLRIGILFGSGIELGIGMHAQPDIDTAASTNSTIKTVILILLLCLMRGFNLERSSFNLYYTTQDQGFPEAFPGISQYP